MLTSQYIYIMGGRCKTKEERAPQKELVLESGILYAHFCFKQPIWGTSQRDAS